MGFVLYYKTIDSPEQFRYYYTSLAEILPYEMVREILKWLPHWYRRDATDRVIAFQTHKEYRHLWASIMTDIQMNVPRYIFTLRTRSGYPLRVSVYSPDCNPEMWPGQLQNERVTMTRSIATIHAEFIRSQENQQPSIFSA
jgi:hypothetical protein